MSAAAIFVQRHLECISDAERNIMHLHFCLTFSFDFSDIESVKGNRHIIIHFHPASIDEAVAEIRRPVVQKIVGESAAKTPDKIFLCLGL